jgi:hypothetical protein
MLELRRPLTSGTDTDIDMIEREMEGGVCVEQPADIHEHYVDGKLGGLIGIEEDIEVRELPTKPEAAATAPNPRRRAPYSAQ